MKKLLYKLGLFMQNRYARVDSISLTALILNVVISLAENFIPNLYVRFALWFLETILIVYAVWRPFSKNVWKRDKENRMWIGVLNRIKNGFLLFGRRIKYAKKSVFVVCPSCKVQIRLPRKRGKHFAKCPRCSNRFGVRVYFGKK